MNDKPYIALVDAHAKRNGGNNHVQFVCHPSGLYLSPLVDRKICMVKVTFDLVVSFQFFGDLLAVFPRDAVNDSALVFEPVVDQICYLSVDLFRVFWQDLVSQVRSIERRLEADFVLNAKHFANVILNFDGSCGGKSQDWHVRVLHFQLVKFQVVLPEVLTPIRDTVDLIDDEPVNFSLLVEDSHYVFHSLARN